MSITWALKTTKLLAHESIYWVNVNNDIENYKKNCNTCLEFQQTHPKEKTIHHEIPIKPWDVVGADIFQLNNKNYLCIVNYHRKFLVVKIKGLSVDSLILALKVVFAEYGIPKRVMSDAGSNFISEKYKNFYKSLNIEQAVSSSYNHQCNGQVEACIKFIKCTMKKFFDSGGDIHIAILQITTTPLGQSLPSPATLLFNGPVRGIMPVMDRLPININNDEEHHKALTNRQCRND